MKMTELLPPKVCPFTLKRIFFHQRLICFRKGFIEKENTKAVSFTRMEKNHGGIPSTLHPQTTKIQMAHF